METTLLSGCNNTSELSEIELDDAAWDAFVARQPDGHLLQTSRWARFKAETGWERARVALARHGEVVAGASVLFRRLPMGQRLAYAPKGPLGGWHEPGVGMRLMDALHALARRRGAFMLKIEPETFQEDAPSLLSAAGFRPSEQTVQPRSTIWIDLSGSEEQIRARMKAKTRYNIGLSARKEVAVRDGGLDDLPAFHRLMDETGGRDGFAVHGLEYYDRVFRVFSPAGLCKLLLATYRDQLLAGLMVFRCGSKAWYMYGASSGQERQRMPNYALQWAAITWAREAGCQVYDLWGIPDEVGQAPERYSRTITDRTDGLWSVYRFKQGFGGQVIRYVGAYDYVYDPLRYRLYHAALKLRRSGLVPG